MGRVVHQQLIVTTNFEDLAAETHERAVQLFGKGRVTKILQSVTNGYFTFLVGTSGSKQGWNEAINHDNQMFELINFISKINRDKEGRYIRYAEVIMDEDDEPVTHVSRGV